jgi:hypothetical protein
MTVRAVVQAVVLLVVALASSAMLGCARQKTIDQERLRSEIRAAISFTAEFDMFVEYVRQGHATRRYAREHAAYLEDAVSKSAKELDEVTPAAGLENPYTECKNQLAQLHAELSRIQGADDNHQDLVSIRENLKKIREGLEKASSKL